MNNFTTVSYLFEWGYFKKLGYNSLQLGIELLQNQEDLM